MFPYIKHFSLSPAGFKTSIIHFLLDTHTVYISISYTDIYSTGAQIRLSLRESKLLWGCKLTSRKRPEKPDKSVNLGYKPPKPATINKSAEIWPSWKGEFGQLLENLHLCRWFNKKTILNIWSYENRFCNLHRIWGPVLSLSCYLVCVIFSL